MEDKDQGNEATSKSASRPSLPPSGKKDIPAKEGQSGVSAKSARYFAIAEQAFISGSNFLLYVYAARMLPKNQWGALSFALATLLVLQGFQRAFVTVPMVTSGDKHSTFTDSLPFWRQMQGWTTAATLLLLLCFYIMARYYLDAWIAESILLTAILVIPMYYMEFARRVVIMAFSMRRLLVMAAIYAFVLFIAGAIAHWLGYDQHLWGFVVTMALAAIVSCLSARVKLWPVVGSNSGGSWDIFSLWRFGRWAAASSLAYTGYNFAIQAILAAMAGPAALGVFAAARNLTQPVGMLIQAIDSVDKPRAGRAYAQQSMPGLWQITRRSWAWLFTLALPYLTLIGFFSGSLLVFIYGEKYADAATPVQLWCVVMITMILVQPLETGLYVIRRPDWLFYGRAVSAGLILILTPWLVMNWSVNGALVALATGWGLAGAIAAGLLVRLSHQAKSS
jgi:O-antigen/teichoic acid export membrane protein